MVTRSPNLWLQHFLIVIISCFYKNTCLHKNLKNEHERPYTVALNAILYGSFCLKSIIYFDILRYSLWNKTVSVSSSRICIIGRDVSIDYNTTVLPEQNRRKWFPDTMHSQ